MDLPMPVVDPAWLQQHLGEPDLVVADVRWYPDRSAREAYDAAHIRGAVFVDVDADLAGPPVGPGGRHPLQSPEGFAAAMSRLGIGDDTAVVAYDDAGNSNSARLWWMLRVIRHRAAVLDGGLQAWRGSIESGPSPARPPATFSPRHWPPEAIVDAGDVERLRRDPGAVVLDARSAERFRGDAEPIDPVAGHIPGARNAPWAKNLDPRTARFLSGEELRRRYEALGAGAEVEAVAHCGSGVTACHDLIALELAGIDGARLYVGSWSDWISDPSRPVATGADGPTSGEGSLQR